MTVTLDTDEERMNVLHIQTYSCKEKLVVLILPRFLPRTKTLILKPGKSFGRHPTCVERTELQAILENFY